MGPVEFRKQNAVREGGLDRISVSTTDTDRFARCIRSCGLRECIDRGMDANGWDDVEQLEEAYRHRGVGMAMCAQGSGVAGKELGAAKLKMSEDGSFHLHVGGVDTEGMAFLLSGVGQFPTDDARLQDRRVFGDGIRPLTALCRLETVRLEWSRSAGGGL